MTVKINKYKMITHPYHKGYCIVDVSYTGNDIIVDISTGNTKADKIFCEMVLDELNTGKYEEDD